MKKKVKVIVETGKDLFSCFTVDTGGFTKIVGDGKTVRKAIEDFYVCYDEARDYAREKGEDYPEMDFDFIFDIGAFLDYYPFNVTALAAYSGINASLLRQYASGLKTPSKKSIGKFHDAIAKVTSDIAAGHLIDRPVLQYI